MATNKKNDFDWNKSFLVDFHLTSGLSQTAVSTKRHLSQMKGMYNDEKAFQKITKVEDPLVYEFYELGVPEVSGDLAFGTSITYPGKVGNEYFMTKGHFHTVLDRAEVYYCLSGKGMMMMENPEGDVLYEELCPGMAVYVPKRYAHRSINTGNAPLVTFFTFHAEAGHDYGTIETKGFRKIVVEKDGRPAVVDNERWK